MLTTINYQNARFIEWPRMDLVQTSIQNLYPMVANTKIMLSVVWPDKHVAFPDFLEPTNATNDWWSNEFKTFHDQVVCNCTLFEFDTLVFQLPFDGIWIGTIRLYL